MMSIRPIVTRVRPLTMALTMALTAAACATMDAAAPAPDPAHSEPEPAAAPAPAPIPGYDWHLNRHQDEISLAYGVAESDDVRLMLYCVERSRRLTVHKDVEPGAPEIIHLESGGETERFEAESSPSMLGDGLILTADADTAHPVFQRFRRLGWVASWVGDRREAYAAHPGSEAVVENFFAGCG